MTEEEKRQRRLDEEELLKRLKENGKLFRELKELAKDGPLDGLKGVLDAKGIGGEITFLDDDEDDDDDGDCLDYEDEEDEEDEDDDYFLEDDDDDEEDDDDFLDGLGQIDGDEDYLEHDFRRRFKGKDANEIAAELLKELKEGRVFFHDGRPIDFDNIDCKELEKSVEEIMAGGKKKETVK